MNLRNRFSYNPTPYPTTYSFNGMERDDEVKGNGNSYTTEFRQYDPRVGRWLSVDPMSNLSSSWTPYRFGFDNPNIYSDPNGAYEKWWDAYKARREAKKAGFETHRIYGEKGHYVFNAHKKDGSHAVTFNYRTNFENYGKSSVDNSIMTAFFQKPIEATENNKEGKYHDGHSSLYTDKGNAYYNDWMKSRKRINGIEKIVLGNFAIGLSPMVASQAALASPSMFGISSDLTWKTFAIKFGTSAFVQQSVNGKVNILSAFADGTLGYGSSSIIGSGIQLNYDYKKENWSFNTLGNGIKAEEFMYQSAVGMIFGAKSDFLGQNMKSAGINIYSTEFISNSTYQFSSNGLNKIFDEKK